MVDKNIKHLILTLDKKIVGIEKNIDLEIKVKVNPTQ